jgi:hypothetical protein
MKKPTAIGPWPLGIDNVSDPTSVRSDDKGRPIALVDAVNVDIDRSGDAARRRGPRLVVPLPGLHSIWTGQRGTFGVARSILYRLTAAGAVALGQLPSDEPCFYADVDDRTVGSQRLGVFEIVGDQVRPLAPPDGPLPDLTTNPIGGLGAGRYTLAIAYVRNGQEGALSSVRTVTLAEGQGIALGAMEAVADADLARVYRTEPNGAALYHCADVPLGLPRFVIGVGQLGRLATTQFLAQMPGGSFITAWRGLLLIARGRTLIMSQPMNPGLHSPRHGFVQFATRITMLAAVQGGIYVGTRRGVDFLRGGRPAEWTLEEKGALPPAAGGVAYIDGNQLPANYQQAGRRVAVWLAGNGFVLGCDDGSIIEPQGDRLSITAGGTASISALSRRVTATLT